jgi:hypothetical protein
MKEIHNFTCISPNNSKSFKCSNPNHIFKLFHLQIKNVDTYFFQCLCLAFEDILTKSFCVFLQSLPAPSHHIFPKFTRFDITRQNAVVLSRSSHTVVFCFRAIFRTSCVVLYRFLCRVVCQMCYCSSKMARLCHLTKQIPSSVEVLQHFCLWRWLDGSEFLYSILLSGVLSLTSRICMYRPVCSLCTEALCFVW